MVKSNENPLMGKFQLKTYIFLMLYIKYGKYLEIFELFKRREVLEFSMKFISDQH